MDGVNQDSVPAITSGVCSSIIQVNMAFLDLILQQLTTVVLSKLCTVCEFCSELTGLVKTFD